MLGLPYNLSGMIVERGFIMNSLSSSLEDYLEIICNYTNSSKKVRAIDISRKLNVSRASTTEALKKLADKKLINYGRYDAISLTESGKEIAETIISKHSVLQNFFEKVLKLDTEEASYNACKIEHIITNNAYKKIIEYLNNQEFKTNENS